MMSNDKHGDESRHMLKIRFVDGQESAEDGGIILSKHVVYQDETIDYERLIERIADGTATEEERALALANPMCRFF